MNKLFNTVALAVAGTILAAKYLKPIKAYAWLGKTHEDITGFALDMFEKEKKNQLVAFYKNYRDKLCEGSKAPDLDGDADKGTGTHYYSSLDLKGKALPQKGGYYRNRLGKYGKSARTMLEENYTSALGLYKSGRVDEAMFVLGRAAHFVEDIACPPHSTNQQCLEKSDNLHYVFEKYAEKTSKKYAPVSFDKRLVNTYSEDSFEGALNKLSTTSGKYSPQIASLDESAFDKSEKALVPLASEHVMALLTRFYNDCKDGKGNFLVDGALCSFRSEKNGLMLTYTPKGVSLEKLDHSKEQRFTVVMSDNGSFALKAKDGTFLSADLKKFEKPVEDGKGSLLRAAALGKNRFRLSAGEGFSKVVECSRSSLSLGDFAPGDNSQVWIIM